MAALLANKAAAMVPKAIEEGNREAAIKAWIALGFAHFAVNVFGNDDELREATSKILADCRATLPEGFYTEVEAWEAAHPGSDSC